MGWPSDPTAIEPDACVDFETAKPAAYEAVSFDTLSKLPRPKVDQLLRYIQTGFVAAPDRVVEMLKCIREGKPYDDGSRVAMAEVTSVSARQVTVEMARAAIPVEALLARLVEVAATGKISGREVKTGEQLDALKFLTNKILPDSKASELDERAARLDRKKAKVEDLTEEQLKTMSADELRELARGAMR